MTKKDFSFVFFGSSNFSVHVLEKLQELQIKPVLLITTEDKPKGRNLVVSPNPAKIWAEKNGIKVYQPKSLKELDSEIIETLKSADFSLVASYGKIIPKELLDLPKHGTLNMHPSLLPKWRGASPIQSTIINDTTAGVSIIILDEQMDHGPIIVQKETTKWEKENPPYYSILEQQLAHDSAILFSNTINDFIHGRIEPQEQNHDIATFCNKIDKEMGKIDLDNDPLENIRKIRGYDGTIKTYFFHNNKRVVIKKAYIENNSLVIERVVPEGKKEMSWVDFLNGNKLV